MNHRVIEATEKNIFLSFLSVFSVVYFAVLSFGEGIIVWIVIYLYFKYSHNEHPTDRSTEG